MLGGEKSRSGVGSRPRSEVQPWSAPYCFPMKRFARHGHNDCMKREKLEQLRKQFMAGIWIGAGLLVFGVFEGQPVFWVLGLLLLGVSAFRFQKISGVQPQDDEKS